MRFRITMNYAFVRTVCLKLITLGAVTSLLAGQTSPLPKSSENVFRPEKLAEMDAAVQRAIASHKCPGGVLWFEHRGAVYHKAYGNRALVPEKEPMTED